MRNRESKIYSWNRKCNHNVPFLWDINYASDTRVSNRSANGDRCRLIDVLEKQLIPRWSLISVLRPRSCITLRYTAPVECLFWRRDKMPYIGKRLLQVITDKRLDEHPIFFHVFSNGGAFLYQHVSLAMQRANTPFKVWTRRKSFQISLLKVHFRLYVQFVLELGIIYRE